MRSRVLKLVGEISSFSFLSFLITAILIWIFLSEKLRELIISNRIIHLLFSLIIEIPVAIFLMPTIALYLKLTRLGIKAKGQVFIDDKGHFWIRIYLKS